MTDSPLCPSGAGSESKPVVQIVSGVDVAAPSKLRWFWDRCHISGRIGPRGIEGMHPIPK